MRRLLDRDRIVCHASECRRETHATRLQAASKVSRSSAARLRTPATVSLPPAAESQMPATGSRPPATGSRPPASAPRSPGSLFRPPGLAGRSQALPVKEQTEANHIGTSPSPLFMGSKICIFDFIRQNRPSSIQARGPRKTRMILKSIQQRFCAIFEGLKRYHLSPAGSPRHPDRPPVFPTHASIDGSRIFAAFQARF